MNVCDEEIRYILKFYYKKGKKVSIRVAQMWFKRFKSWNFSAQDEVRSERSVTDKINVIFEKVE